MARWVNLTTPAAVVVSVSSAAYAVQYLTLPEAQKHVFPSATNFAVIQADRIWRAEAGGRTVGFFIFDRVIGKPGQRLRIEMIDPERNRSGLPIAEQRMLEWRIDQRDIFDRVLEPEALVTLPGASVAKSSLPTSVSRRFSSGARISRKCGGCAPSSPRIIASGN